MKRLEEERNEDDDYKSEQEDKTEEQPAEPENKEDEDAELPAEPSIEVPKIKTPEVKVIVDGESDDDWSPIEIQEKIRNWI